MPGFVRYTDATGATVYSSHSYQPLKGHARGASGYSLANSDFEERFDDLPSPGPHNMANCEAREASDSEDGYQEDSNYKDREHEDRHPPGLHDTENHERHSTTSSRTMVMDMRPMTAHDGP